ncbi:MULTISPECIES: hypothetical protein [unclassified Microcoleus]|uniref:hypothetical protein n=1 Tax=unclassified Microcoleus TaxID=2642155 RepID=UPI001E0FEF07|nr:MULTISPECIES: hypothetical protein [unclassified Microcoleus]MCC3473980.1 hypothetical protein [Microcoleus sp. PH2017_13_LAR_U_A]MCC3486062.1 hypothetical protein [Microcoleus sp. PH2017_14_LAR_D_A]MCC3598594.1 hypothetical protein [Microcoleus sp. PH2017_26_ELK_O_A]MCC3623924.1 hypothetical protein [Microcoleus sp. PH2017_36_ELK_O_B]
MELTEEISINLEETLEFQKWKQAKLDETIRYLKLSFGDDVPIEQLSLRLASDSYPDPILQQRAHAQVWGYNYKDLDGNIIVNPSNGKLMSYTCWKSLAVAVSEPVSGDTGIE